MKKSTLIVASIILIAGLAALGFGAARKHHDGEGHHAFGQDRGPGGRGGPRGGDRIFRQLDLTDAQKTQIKALHEKQRDEAKANHDQLRAIREQMRPLIENSAFDETAVRALLAKETQLMTEMQVVDARTRNAVFNLLTTEQKAKLAELRSKREAHRGGPGEK